jgi:hypothetical protein
MTKLAGTLTQLIHRRRSGSRQSLLADWSKPGFSWSLPSRQEGILAARVIASLSAVAKPSRVTGLKGVKPDEQVFCACCADLHCLPCLCW